MENSICNHSVCVCDVSRLYTRKGVKCDCVSGSYYDDSIDACVCAEDYGLSLDRKICVQCDSKVSKQYIDDEGVCVCKPGAEPRGQNGCECIYGSEIKTENGPECPQGPSSSIASIVVGGYSVEYSQSSSSNSAKEAKTSSNNNTVINMKSSNMSASSYK